MVALVSSSATASAAASSSVFLTQSHSSARQLRRVSPEAPLPPRNTTRKAKARIRMNWPQSSWV